MFYSKRKLAAVLVLLMVLSSVSMLGATPVNQDRSEVLERYLEQENSFSETPNRLNPDDYTTWDPEKEYRVIVQLTGDAAIEASSEQEEKYHELPPGLRKNLERGILGEQRGIIQNLERRGIDLEVLHNFTVGINGFSALVKGYEIEEIKQVPDVKDVFISNEYEKPEPTPEMEFTHDMIGSEAVWSNLGYRGEGMVVAVVDTGIQWTHPDFNPDYEDYDLVVNEALIDELDLIGEYKTPKVVYGYNYFDEQQTVEDMNNNHGQHVAGTVAADGGISGVAPKAQLIDIQVFSEDPETPSTWDDIYLRGIEDALKIGVDAVNMSLGAVASFYQPNNAVDEMITSAREDGVVFAISAGNSAYSTDGIGFPWRENPDVGMVGAPSLNKDSISVASADNVMVERLAANLTINDEESLLPYHLPSDSPDPVEVLTEPKEVVYVGTGEPEYYEGLDVEGKIVLAVRTGGYFYEYIKDTAEANGAAGVLVRGAEAHGNFVNPALGDEAPQVPYLTLSIADGNNLRDALVDGESVMIEFEGETLVLPNPTGGQMSAFTSWGTTPSLDMKPEVTAPGGMINSTLLDGNYGLMSGTSMAAPHVAGSTALVQQHLLNEGMDREEVAEMSKIRHMNTADPIRDAFGNLYSPRRQGAGMIRPDKAIMTPVTVVNQYDGEAKVQLRDFQDEVFTMTLDATNHSDEAVTYDVDVDVIVDELIAVLMWQWMDSAPLVDVVVTGDEEVTIEPGAMETVTVTVDISEAKIPAFHPAIGYAEYPVVDYPNLFVEGFINLEERIDNSDNDTHDEIGLDLVVPFVGFYGDWAGENSPRILDGFDYYGEDSFFGNGVLVDQDSFILGYDPEYEYEGILDRIAISPLNEEGRNMAIPVFSMMRNAEKVEFRALNEDREIIREIGTAEWLRKSFWANPGYYLPQFGWDGLDDEGNIVEDGQYYYEIAVLPHYEDAVWQTKQIPVMVDTQAPVAEEIRYDKEAKELSWTVTDEGVGPVYMELRVDGEVYETFIAREQEYVVEDFEFRPDHKVEIMIEDYAGNEGVYQLSPSQRGNRPPQSLQPNPGRGRN